MRPRFHAIEFSFKESASGPLGTPYGRGLPFMKKSNKSVRCAGEPNKMLLVLPIKYREWLAPLSVSWMVHCTKLKWNADCNHRVPEVNANSNGDWNWNLGNFENVWNDNNAFLCFCNKFGFSSTQFILVGEFFLAHFFSMPQAVYLCHLDLE